ncbi:hypothetical protein Ancab_007991, partial [Ancistrocladus abbreviatus]
MDSIWVVTYKVRVSIARGRKVNNNTEINEKNHWLLRMHLPFHQNRSYADVVRQPPGKLKTNYEFGGKASSRTARGITRKECKALAFTAVEENL